MNINELIARIDPATGELSGPVKTVKRHLSDLRGCFQEREAYDQALAQGDPMLYSVSAVEPGSNSGDLHYGLGTLMPGKIGREYYMTKGHLHSWREAAEIYIGVSGEGLMLLENEKTGESQVLPLKPSHIVYVPGFTAHRTINTGTVPLKYLGIYPARAGHDYAVIAQNNFRCVVVEQNTQPSMVARAVAENALR